MGFPPDTASSTRSEARTKTWPQINHHARKSCPHVMPSCHALMSYALMSCPRVMPSCHALMSCPHVMPSCHMPSCHALTSCPHVMPSCHMLSYVMPSCHALMSCPHCPGQQRMSLTQYRLYVLHQRSEFSHLPTGSSRWNREQAFMHR